MLVKEYADLVKVSVQAVTKRLKRNNPPAAIKAYRKFGNTYDLEVDTELLSKAITKKSKQEVA